MRLLVFLLLIAVLYYVFWYRRPAPAPTTYGTDRRIEQSPRGAEGPGEQAGRVVDRALNKAGEAVEHFGERLQDATAPSVATPTPI
jgi:hypothetical protein